MKNKIIFFISLLSGLSALALPSSVRKELLLDIKEETKKCALEIVSTSRDAKEVAGYETSCNSLKILSGQEAQVFVEGNWYTVRIKEAAESDGGDLDDLFVYNEAGEVVAKKTNVAAYNSVIRAMAGDSVLQQKGQ